MVMFVDVPTDPFIHPWPDGSALVSSKVGTTSLTPTWTSTKNGSNTVAYRMIGSYNPWVRVSNSTHAIVITGLTPGTSYDLRIDAINDQGDYWPRPNTFLVTGTASLPPSEPTTQPTPGRVTDLNSKQIFSAFLRYWSIVLLGISMSAVTVIFLLARAKPLRIRLEYDFHLRLQVRNAVEAVTLSANEMRGGASCTAGSLDSDFFDFSIFSET